MANCFILKSIFVSENYQTMFDLVLETEIKQGLALLQPELGLFFCEFKINKIDRFLQV